MPGGRPKVKKKDKIRTCERCGGKFSWGEKYGKRYCSVDCVRKESFSCGRPTKMTDETLRKLEEAFAIGCTDAEASFYAGIHKQTLYEYCKKNPSFSDRKEGLKKRPIMKARQTVVGDLKEPDTAKWYLSKKQKDEFGDKQPGVLPEGSIQGNITINQNVLVLKNEYEEKLFKQLSTDET